ncbi:hypothetical protein E2L08_15095 [Palleronia sediminis]|uniref:Flagellin C-terminal domain-containing protein n=1 Tax=Palleronia sediminis TaxID=2547833 RepID=A0A4R5ZYX5_9RHOB|nr:flagellin [Palleronia sediminis]TDL75237.1 hypothetical protein E2L08_15095 [Palleronia sediminis]
MQSIGDLAQSFLLRRGAARLEAETTRLGQALTTGLAPDIAAATGGDTRAIAALSRDLTLADTYDRAAVEMGLRAAGAQAALGAISGRLSTLTGQTATLTGAASPQALDALSSEGRNAFLGAIGDLNTAVAGHSVFAGTRVDAPAVISGDAILGKLRALTAGMTTAGDIGAAIDGYFGPGGEFSTADYRGSPAPAPAIAIAQGQRAAIGLTADDPALRSGLAAAAKLALLDDASQAARAALAIDARADLMPAERAITGLRGRLGATEAQIDAARASTAARRHALESERNARIGVDPYETATRLQQAMAQLDTLHAVTARLSRLSLVNHL